MCQTLLHIPAKVAGYPMFGAGVLLAVWAVASVAVITWLVRRRGFNSDTLSYVPILLLFGAIIYWVLPAIAEPEGLPIRGYGTMVMLAVVAGTVLAVWRAKRVGVNPDTVISLIFWIIVPGIIGARLFHVIEFWRTNYLPAYTNPGGGLRPLLGAVVNITAGGLVVYGAFLGGIAGLIAFVRKHRLPLLAVCDLMAPSMVLGAAIGRIGCLMNGCCFGAVCDHPWAIEFPAGSPPYEAQMERGQFYGFSLGKNPKADARVLSVDANSPAAQAGLKPGDQLRSVNGQKIASNYDAYAALTEAFTHGQPLHLGVNERAVIVVPQLSPPARSLPVHPTQIYSVFDGLLICLLLLVVDRFRRRDGVLFALLLSIYPVTRFFIESLRSDEGDVFGTGMSIAQNVSLLLLVCAVALWFYVLRQPKKLAFLRQAIAPTTAVRNG